MAGGSFPWTGDMWMQLLLKFITTAPVLVGIWYQASYRVFKKYHPPSNAIINLRWPVVTNKMCCSEKSRKIFNGIAEMNGAANFVTLCPNDLEGKGKQVMHEFKNWESNSIKGGRGREGSCGSLKQLTQEQHPKGSWDKWLIDRWFCIYYLAPLEAWNCQREIPFLHY